MWQVWCDAQDSPISIFSYLAGLKVLIHSVILLMRYRLEMVSGISCLKAIVFPFDLWILPNNIYPVLFHSCIPPVKFSAASPEIISLMHLTKGQWPILNSQPMRLSFTWRATKPKKRHSTIYHSSFQLNEKWKRRALHFCGASFDIWKLHSPTNHRYRWWFFLFSERSFEVEVPWLWFKAGISWFENLTGMKNVWKEPS